MCVGPVSKQRAKNQDLIGKGRGRSDAKRVKKVKGG